MKNYYLPGGTKVTEDDIGNVTWFAPRQEQFEKAARETNCFNYRQCPVCYKCVNKAPHLYEQCAKCKVAWCHHKEEDRSKLIKPENFYLAGKELKKDISNEYHSFKVIDRISKLSNIKLTKEQLSDILNTYSYEIHELSTADDDTLNLVIKNYITNKGENKYAIENKDND
jgi:hypothetical protein